MKQLPKRKGTDFNELFKGWPNHDAIDLLKKCWPSIQQNESLSKELFLILTWRIHFVDDEPVGEPVSRYDFDFELYSLKTPEYKELIFEEI